MECLKCSKLNEDGAKYCSGCGKRLARRLYDRAAWEEKSRKIRWRKWLFRAITCLGVVFWFVAMVNITWEGKWGYFCLVIIGLFLAVIGSLLNGWFSSVEGGQRQWRKRISQSADAAKEFAAMIEWQSYCVGLEPLSPIQFKRKIGEG